MRTHDRFAGSHRNVRRGVLFELLPDVPRKLIVVPVLDGGADDTEALWQTALVIQLRQGGQQKASGEIAGRAKQNQSPNHRPARTTWRRAKAIDSRNRF